ncbi:MAG: hypothetical protein KIT17_28215, partial [Rubrivivax sp.]|nr:hypothetical protein [Rubrivivax sp.]
MSWWFASIWVLVLLLAPDLARAEDCPERYRIVFADGTRACLTDYPLAREDATALFTSVRRMVPSHGYFALAATPALPHCKRAIGMGLMPGAFVTPQATAEADFRMQKALQDCRLRVLGAPPDCACRLLLVDGRSLLSAAEFARYADPQQAVAAAAATPATRASAA